MKYSTKLSDTIHILIFIALGDEEQLSSTKICRKYQDKPSLCQTAYGNPENAALLSTHKVMRMPLLQNRQIKSICMTSTER